MEELGEVAVIVMLNAEDHRQTEATGMITILEGRAGV